MLAALGTLLLLCADRVIPAATLTWTGAGANSYWTNSANWGGRIPTDGDTLIFPHGTPRLVNTNTISNLVLRRIRFTGSGLGHTLRGTSLTVTNGIRAEQTSGLSSLDLAVRLGTTGQTFANVGSGILYFSGGIALYGCDLTFTNTSGGSIDVTSRISGSADLTKTGAGQLRFAAPSTNSYHGIMRLIAGTMVLECASSNAITGDFEIGSSNTTASVRWFGHHQVAPEANVLVQNGSVMDLDGHSNTVASLTFVNGGTVTTGAGRLDLGGNVTTTSTNVTATINGRLHLGNTTRTFTVNGPEDDPGLVINANLSGGSTSVGPGIRLAGLVKRGPGEMVLAGTNTYGGHTTVNEGGLTVSSDTGLGGTLSGTSVNNDARLWLDGASVGTKDLTLNPTDASGGLRATGVCGLDGDIILQTNATILGYGGTLTLNGQIRGTGDLTLGDPWYPGATFVFGGSTSNLYTGEVKVGVKSRGQTIYYGLTP